MNAESAGLTPVVIGLPEKETQSFDVSLPFEPGGPVFDPVGRKPPGGVVAPSLRKRR